MKTISSIEELADALFEVHQNTTMDNADFCQCLVSCVVSVATRDGLEDKEIFDTIIRASTGALVTVRAREQMKKLGLNVNLEVH